MWCCSRCWRSWQSSACGGSGGNKAGADVPRTRTLVFEVPDDADPPAAAFAAAVARRTHGRIRIQHDLASPYTSAVPANELRLVHALEAGTVAVAYLPARAWALAGALGLQGAARPVRPVDGTRLPALRAEYPRDRGASVAADVGRRARARPGRGAALSCHPSADDEGRVRRAPHSHHRQPADGRRSAVARCAARRAAAMPIRRATCSTRSGSTESSPLRRASSATATRRWPATSRRIRRSRSSRASWSAGTSGSNCRPSSSRSCVPLPVPRLRRALLSVPKAERQELTELCQADGVPAQTFCLPARRDRGGDAGDGAALRLRHCRQGAAEPAASSPGHRRAAARDAAAFPVHPAGVAGRPGGASRWRDDSGRRLYGHRHLQGLARPAA